jgi:hypothetical protein
MRFAVMWKAADTEYAWASARRNLHRFVAKRMGATTVELRSSHVPMLSQPDGVLDVIRNAARAVQNSETA